MWENEIWLIIHFICKERVKDALLIMRGYVVTVAKGNIIVGQLFNGRELMKGTEPSKGPE